MITLKGLTQLGIGSPTNKDIKGKKITPSGGVRVTGPGESGNGGTFNLQDKFPQEIDKCLRACRSYEKIKQQTEESRLGNRSNSWVRLGSPIPNTKARNLHEKSTEKRPSINKLRGARLGQKKLSQAEAGQLLSPKKGTKLQFKTSLLKNQTPLVPETSFLKSPKKSAIQLGEQQLSRLGRGSEQKKIKDNLGGPEKKKKKQALQKLNEHLTKMNAENETIKPEAKQKKNLREYILNISPPVEESQLKRNRSFKKTFENEHKKIKASEGECQSGDEDLLAMAHKKMSNKLKMTKLAMKPMLMPAKDFNQGGQVLRHKSPGGKSKKSLSLHIQEIPDSLKQKISELMSKKKSIDVTTKPIRKLKSKFSYKRIPKTPTNDLVNQIMDPTRAKSPKGLQKNPKKRKVQKKLMPSKPVEEIEFEGRIYTLKDSFKPTNKKQRESGSNQYIDIDLNHDSDRLKPKDSISSDAEGSPHSKGVILKTPNDLSSQNRRTNSHSGLKGLVGFQPHVELEDIVGPTLHNQEVESEQNAILEQPVRIPAYEKPTQSIDEPAKFFTSDPPSDSRSRKKSKTSTTEKKNLLINTNSKVYDRPEVDSLVVIEQSEDGQIKKVDECVQVSIETFRKSEKDLLPIKSEISIIKKESEDFKNQLKLEDLAKEEYQKWSQVNCMLKDIEEKIGSKAAIEIKQLFSRLDSFANQSKKKLKDAFLASDMCLSNQQSERRSKVNDDLASGLAREQRFGAVFNANDTHDESSRNQSFQPSVVLIKKPQASSKKTKTYKKNEMEIWPDGLIPHSSSITPNSMNLQQIL